MGTKTMQNFTLISKLLRKMQKLANKKLQAKKGAKLGIFLFNTTNLQKNFANNFSWVHFFQFFFFNSFHRFEISMKFCVFWIVISKKRIKIFLGLLSTYIINAN